MCVHLFVPVERENTTQHKFKWCFAATAGKKYQNKSIKMFKSYILRQKYDKILQVTEYDNKTYQDDAAAQHYHCITFLYLITLKYYTRNLGQVLPHLNEVKSKTGYFTEQIW